MQYRKLGRTNFEAGDIGYGAWGIAFSAETMAVLKRHAWDRNCYC
jgi:aryl-alcohol dehydrogenase-like predicted oxidoreductase